jgi:hypothetical protein
VKGHAARCLRSRRSWLLRPLGLECRVAGETKLTLIAVGISRLRSKPQAPAKKTAQTCAMGLLMAADVFSPKSHLQAKTVRISNVEHAMVPAQIVLSTHPCLLRHVVVGLLGTLSNLARASDRCGSVDRTKIALRLTEAIYPETKSREFDVSVGNGYSGPPSCPTDARAVMVTVSKDSWLVFSKPDSDVEKYFSEKGLEIPFHLRFDFHRFAAAFSRLPTRRPERPSERRTLQCAATDAVSS